MIMSVWNSPSTSQVDDESPEITPIIPANCSPNLVKRMQQDTCYTCQQKGHWSWYCPSKSPKTKPISPSPSPSPNKHSHSTILSSSGHGSCKLKHSSYYASPIKRDELVSSNSKKGSGQRTLDEFWERCQNDKNKDELGNERGHWCRYSPSKSPNSKSFSPSVSSKTIQCRCGHGACEIKPARCGRNFYTCPIKRGEKCKGFVKWCDDPVVERDLQPPPFKYPECECTAGVCRRVKGTEGPDAFKYYFTCPIKQGHGSCGYRVWEDEIKLLSRKSIVPIQQSRQRTLHDFWEGWQNDEFDDRLDNELSKWMKIRDCSEDPSLTAASGILDKEDVGEKPNAANLKLVDFPDLVVDDDEIEFTNSISWDTIEAEACMSLSRLSTPSRICWRQIMFQRPLFFDASFGSCLMGWLGRRLFFYPTRSLKLPTPKPFFCCVFPSYNPIVVPKQTSIPDGPCNQLAICTVNEVSGHVISPSKSQDGDRKSILSKAQRHREVVLFTQQRLLIDLETLASHEHESMREAAENTFALLNVLGVDYKQFSDNVLDYINFVLSIAEIDKSMENSLTVEDLNKLFEEEKMRFAQLHDDHVKTEALLEALNRQRQLLCGQISNLKAMLYEKQNQLKFCELETLKIETHLRDLKRNILETDITLKERAEQTEVARKQSEERQAKQIAAEESLQRAKLELEN